MRPQKYCFQQFPAPSRNVTQTPFIYPMIASRSQNISQRRHPTLSLHIVTDNPKSCHDIAPQRPMQLHRDSDISYQESYSHSPLSPVSPQQPSTASLLLKHKKSDIDKENHSMITFYDVTGLYT